MMFFDYLIVCECEQAWQVFFLIEYVCNQILILKSVVRFIPFLSKRGDWDGFMREQRSD